MLNDGSEITDVNEILQQQTAFYKELYSNKDDASTQGYQDEVLSSLEAPRLSNQMSESLEGKITYQELTKCIKQMKNNKSPGLDGFSNEFYKFFWG